MIFFKIIRLHQTMYPWICQIKKLSSMKKKMAANSFTDERMETHVTCIDNSCQEYLAEFYSDKTTQNLSPHQPALALDVIQVKVQELLSILR